jgi:hypothetical protein
MWKLHDPTALPTPEEKRLNDCALHTLSSQLFVAKQLAHDAEELFRQRNAEVDRIEREIAFHKYYVASVRKLPAEILAEIGMILVMKSDVNHWEDIWNFSWTCRAWRNALLANPNIWGARIIVPTCQNQFSLITTARDYARGSHVSLSVTIRASLHQASFTSILQYRPKQITSLHISIKGYSWLPHSTIRSLPNLRRIALYGDIDATLREYYRPLLDTLIPRKNCRTSATKLHEVFLSDIFTGSPRVFARLKSLYLVHCTLPTPEHFVYGISGSSDTLENLTLHICQWSSSVSTPTSPPRGFPRLRNLRTSGTPQARLLRLMRFEVLELFEVGDRDEIWGDSLTNFESLPSVLPVLGLHVMSGWSQMDLMQQSLQICLKRSTTLRIYGEWRSLSVIDECCEVLKQNPRAFGDSITHMEIVCHRVTSEQFSMGHLASIKAAFDSTGRDISITAFIWDPYPPSVALWGMWGMFAMSLIGTFFEHFPRSFGNDADAPQLRPDLHRQHLFMPFASPS